MPPPPPHQDAGYPGMAPPAPTEAAPPRSAWPIAVGVISIVWGAFGLVCIPINLVSEVALSDYVEQQWQFPAWFRSWSIVQSLLLIAIDAVLLVGGIMLVKRRAAAAGIHFAYGWSALALTVIGVSFTLVAIPDISGRMEEAERIALWVGLVVGTALGVAYPIFCLIWFRRRKIREEIRTWRKEPAETFGQMYQQ